MMTNSNSRGARVIGRLRATACAATLLLVVGCAAFPSMHVRPATSPAVDQSEVSVLADPASGTGAVGEGRSAARETLRLPGERSEAAAARPPATDAQIAEIIPDEMTDVSLAPQSIPQFVATAFGTVLGIPYTMTPDVAARQEVISGGSGGTISKRNLFRLVQQALKQYGIELYIEGGFVTVGAPDTSPGGAQVVRSREARPGSGRVLQIFSVQTLDISVVQTLLTDVFPNLGGVRITPDPASNSLLISGSSRDVAALVSVLRDIDQPRFAGAEVLRVEPVFSSADALAGSIEQALTTEGYVVSRASNLGRAVTILSFPSANQILIFTKDPVLLDRARFWVSTLDQPAALGDKLTTFVYQVRNTDAQSLGQLAMGQAPQGNTPQPPVGVPGTVADTGGPGLAQNSNQGNQSGAQGTFLGGRLIVDPMGNRVLFTGTASDFAQLRSLLSTLDIPAPQVVVEVTIAEVTLSDRTALGINFFGSEVTSDGTWTGGTDPGVTLGAAGANITFVGPDFRARLNAEASNNRVNILQRPRLVMRSGGTARFQVGTDVPIISSQRATDFQTGGGTTDILQNVQYRQTGVILEVKPIVYGDRVDISISQETSEAGEPPNSAIASPTILNRSLTTQIAITDGWTGVLGGLIGNSYSKVNAGVPFLKDIPIVGSAFQNNTVRGDRTELLVMITPYIVRNDEDMADFAAQYTADMNAAFRTGRGYSYTLTPFSLGGFRGIGLDLPSPQPASERRAPPPSPTPETTPVAESAQTP
jgi:general secretion pathway protein D